MRLGLGPDGWQHQWSEFVFASEAGWNLAASDPGGRRQLAKLSDKFYTTEVLARAQIPTPEQQLVRAGTYSEKHVAALIESWLRRWPGVHGKPRFGSRGTGAFRLERGEGWPFRPATERPGSAIGHDAQERGWILREYVSDDLIDDSITWLVKHLRTGDYMVQELLSTHTKLADVASSSDVVTQRIVTRRAREVVDLFSVVLEIPLPLHDRRRSYTLLKVDADGYIVGRARPRWLPLAESGVQNALTDDLQRVEAALVGSKVPGFMDAVNNAQHAHALFPSVFAIAWDTAVTHRGQLFLEGNGGFGTQAPQWVSGGLLSRLP